MTNASLKLEALEEAIYSKVLEVIRLLRESKRRIVLAESCTGGMVAAWFAGIPGVSEVFCGSMVVYRNDTKSKWLGLDPRMLSDEKIGPVSPQASEQLARKVLSRTPEAHVSVGITGHFGPNAPVELHHKIFLVGFTGQVESGSLGGDLDSNPMLWSRDCNLEASSLFFDGITDNRKYLQSLAVFETLCFTTEMLEG